MDAEKLNELQCALAGERSKEVDRIISGQVSDKAQAEQLQAAIDRLPRIEDADREMVEEAVRKYRDKVRHQRWPYQHKVVDGVLRMKVQLFNDFHETEVEVWPQVIDDFTVMFTPEQVATCRETLCPDGRQCVGLLGERWRGPGYADVFKEDKDGNVYAKAISFFADPAELEEY